MIVRKPWMLDDDHLWDRLHTKQREERAHVIT